MEDKQIVDLFWQRSEAAIVAAASKYGKYCSKIAYNILQNYEDSEECVNDTYLKAWGAIPTHRPTRLSTFLGKITRNLALNKWEYLNAEKRGSGQISFVLEELQECVPDVDNTEKIADDLALIEVLNHFLAGLPKEQRIIFLRRYWYLCSVKEIAANHSIIIDLPHPTSQNHPRMSLYDRAAQFSPFAALTGHHAAIAETGRLTDRRIELDESEITRVDAALQHLQKLLPGRPTVSITYFVPDERKSGGSYQTVTGEVKRIDTVAGMIQMTDRREIPIEDVFSVEIVV